MTKDPREARASPASPQSGALDQPQTEERSLERPESAPPLPESGEFTPDPGS